MRTTTTAYVLWILGGCGILGLHRFYLRRPRTGLLWMLTGGVALVGGLVDAFRLPGMVQVENLTRQLVLEARRDDDLWAPTTA